MNEFITIFLSTNKYINLIKNIELVNSIRNLNKTSLWFQVDEDQKKDMKTTETNVIVEIVAI